MVELTLRQLEQFRADGFLPVERLIDQADVLALRQSFDRLFRGDFVLGVRPDEVNWQCGDSPELTRQICNGWRADPLVADVVTRPAIGRALAQLGGWPGSRLAQDNVIWKPAGARSIGYHQDNGYIAWLSPREMLSCWIALDPTSERGGTLEVARGSHNWGLAQSTGAFHAPPDFRDAMVRAAAAARTRPELVSVVVPAGGGVFHHGALWHGSAENEAKTPRRALVIHAVSSHARFVRERISEGNGPIYGRYMRGSDSLLDENHFPILWGDGAPDSGEDVTRAGAGR